MDAVAGFEQVAGQGEVVLICGTRALEVARKASLVPKNRSLANLRAQLFRPGHGGHYQITYEPAITDSEPDKHELIAWDLRLAARFLETRSLHPEVGTYRWVGGYSELVSAIDCKFAATGKAVDVSMDTETEGLHPWYPNKQIISIGFTCAAGRADCLHADPYDDPVPASAPDLKQQLAWLLNAPKVKLRGSNLKYDPVCIAKKWGRVHELLDHPGTPIPGSSEIDAVTSA